MSADVERLAREVETLQREIETLRGEKRRLEQQNASLASLYVAAYRLHGTIDRPEVVAIIQEIVINVVGCEETGLFEVAPDGASLELIASFGLPPGVLERVPLGAGVIGSSVRNGALWLAGDEPRPTGADETHLSACVPLVLAGRVIGAIAVFRLLPHKAALTREDHELFELLGTHAATALYCTGLHARAAELGHARGA